MAVVSTEAESDSTTSFGTNVNNVLRPATVVLLSAVATLAACTPDLPDKPSAADVLAQTDRWLVGKQGLANKLYDDDVFAGYVAAEICTGDSQWLAVAHRAFPTNYAHLNEDLSSALSVALVTSPSEVLRSFGSEPCHLPDDLPASCVTTEWPARARRAIDAISSPTLDASKGECLKQIDAITMRSTNAQQ